MPRSAASCSRMGPSGSCGSPAKGRIGVPAAARGPRISVQFGGVRRASSPGPACGKTEGSVRLRERRVDRGWVPPAAAAERGCPEKGCSKPPCADNGARSAVRFGGLSRASSPSPGPACGKMGALASCRAAARAGRGAGCREGAAGGGGLGAVGLEGPARGVGRGAAEEPATPHGVGVEEATEAAHDAGAAARLHGLSRLRVMVLHELLQYVKVGEARPRCRRRLSLRVGEGAEGRRECERGGENKPRAGRRHRRLRRYAGRARKECARDARTSRRYRSSARSETGPCG